MGGEHSFKRDPKSARGGAAKNLSENWLRERSNEHAKDDLIILHPGFVLRIGSENGLNCVSHYCCDGDRRGWFGTINIAENILSIEMSDNLIFPQEIIVFGYGNSKERVETWDGGNRELKSGCSGNSGRDI